MHPPRGTGRVGDSVDTLVMAASYAAHNRLGRLCDERIYENEVAARLRANGFDNVHTQLPVTVSHGPFTRTYRLDLVADGVIYEIKKSVALALDHQTQAIHYAALCDANRAKLINFGAPKVTGRLLRTPFAEVDRRQFTVSLGRGRVLSERCDVLLERLMALLADWGPLVCATPPLPLDSIRLTRLTNMVEGMFRARQGWFGEKRKSGARKMRGLLEGELFTLRDLRLNVLG